MKRLICWIFGHKEHRSQDEWGATYVWCERCLKFLPGS